MEIEHVFYDFQNQQSPRRCAELAEERCLIVSLLHSVLAALVVSTPHFSRSDHILTFPCDTGVESILLNVNDHHFCTVQNPVNS